MLNNVDSHYKYCRLKRARKVTNANDRRALPDRNRKKETSLSSVSSYLGKTLKSKARPYKACTHVRKMKNVKWLNRAKSN